VKAQSPKDRIADFEHMAGQSLRRHQVMHAESWGWVCANPNSSAYHCRVIAMAPTLIVHGDVDLVAFDRCSGATDNIGVLSWIANASIDYAGEKASIGMGMHMKSYDAACALHEAYQRRRDTESTQERDLWTKVASMITKGALQQEVQQFVYDETHDPNLAAVGEVVSERVIWAWLICKRLYKLL